jgi:hypothetical protein
MASPRVEAKIHQYLFNLRGVCLHRVELGIQKLELDVFSDHLVEKTNQSACDGIEIYRARLQHLAARESQQLACQPRGALGLFTDAREALGHLRIVAVLLESQLSPAQDRAHYVVEVMRDAARQLADGLKLLCLPQLPLDSAQLGDILRDYLQAGWLACHRKLPHVHPHGNQAAVAPPPFGLRSVNSAVFPARAGELCVLFRKPEDVLRQIQRQQILRRCTARDAQQRGIAVLERTVGGNPEYAVRRIFHQVAISRL